MPIGNTYLEDLDTYVTVWVGAVTTDDWESALTQQLDDPDWLRARRFVGDLSAADLSALDSSSRRRIAALLDTRREIVEGRRYAFVVRAGWRIASDFLPELTKDGASAIVFESLSVACAYLGVPPLEVSTAIRAVSDALRDEAS